jgi:hypothetical protein
VRAPAAPIAGGFILRDQAQELLRSPDVVAMGPPPVPYGAIARLPRPVRGVVSQRTWPDARLRAWALEQTAVKQNAPLWDRLHALGLADESSS